MENKNKLPKKSQLYCIAFIIALIIQLVFLTISFALNNTAHHEDEYLNYGRANSQNRTFLYGSSLQVPDNYNTWMTGDDFKYYIETNEDSAFSYDTVWKNAAADTNAPLHDAVLHTICSFFPNRFSWWWAFGINLVCFIITQVFLYKLFSRLAKSQLAGIMVCVYFAFSLFGQSTVYFLRMYMMLTMFAVLYAYFSQSIFTAEGKIPIRYYIFVGGVTLLGALTQHEFLVFAFVYTLVQCIILLVKKRIKHCFAYGGSAAVGAGLSIAAFPATLEHMFSGADSDLVQWSGEIDPAIQGYQYLRLLVKNTVGYIMYYYNINWYADAAFVTVCVLVVLAAACFLCRKEEWFATRWEKFKNMLRRLCAGFKRADLSPIMIIAASVAVFEFIVNKIYIDDFGEEAVRYAFIFLPLLIGVAISRLYIIGTHISRKVCTPVICIVLITLLVYQNARLTPKFVITDNNDNGTISSYVEGQNCVVLESKAIFLPCYCTMLWETNEDYISVYVGGEYENHEDEYKKLYEDGEDFYVMFDTDQVYEDEDVASTEDRLIASGLIIVENDEDEIEESEEESTSDILTYDEIVSYFEDISGYKATYCTTENTHGFNVRLYKFEKQDEN